MNLVALLLGETAGMAAGLAAVNVSRRPARPADAPSESLDGDGPRGEGPPDDKAEPAAEPGPVRSHRAGDATWWVNPTWQVLALAIVAGVVAAVAPGAPTGWTPFDVALKALLGAGLTIAAAEASPRVSVVVTVVALIVSTGSSLQWLAAGACGLSLAILLTKTRLPAVSALSGAMAVQVALRLQRPAISLATAIEGALVLLPLVVVGLRRAARARPRWVLAAVLFAAAFAVVGGGAAGASALSARASVEEGVALLRSGAAQSTGASTFDDRATNFNQAAHAFAQARGSLDSWWARPAAAVPVVAQQFRALRTAANVGQHLSATAASLAHAISVADLHVTSGQVPVDRLTGIEPLLLQTTAQLSQASRQVGAIASPWLVPPLASRLRTESTRLSSTEASARKASLAVPQLPALLGLDGPRRYFLAVQTPSEGRAGGGYLGAFGVITADQGRLSLSTFGALIVLEHGGDPAARQLVAPADYVARYSSFDPQGEWGNINLSPDFPTDAAVIANMYPQSGGVPVDGVIAIDPYALASFLQIVGPVSVPAWPVPITAQNAAQVLLYGQYTNVTSFADAPTRNDFLVALAQATWSRLVSISTPPDALLSALSQTVTGKHLMVGATRPAEESLFHTLGVSGAVAPVQGDFAGLVTQNAAGSKLDYFLHRQLDYRAKLNPSTGAIHATATITLHNDAPSTGDSVYFTSSGIDPPLPEGENQLYLSFYSPWQLSSATLDGKAVSMQAQNELGRRVYSVALVVPAGGTVTLVLHLQGHYTGSAYHLEVFAQPVVTPDRVTTSLQVPWGWRFETSRQADRTTDFVLDHGDASLTVPLARSQWLW
ncbi:MAG: DUF4012 domain-containing protein [Acidimicrobiales bacterium]